MSERTLGLRTAACAVVFFFGAVLPASAQAPCSGTSAGPLTDSAGAPQSADAAAAPAPAPLWTALTIGFGVQAYSGDSRSVALSGSLDWLKQFTHLEVESTVNSQVQLSEGSTTRAGYVNSATRWVSAGRRPKSLYPMAHLSLWHDVSAGIDGLVTVGGGLGAHLLNEPNLRFTLEGGLGETYESQVDAHSYPTTFISPELRWKINDRATLSSQSVAYMNVTSTGDFWVHNEIDFNIQITRTIGLQNQLLASYDRKPVVGKNTTNMQLSVNVAFSLTRGEPPPQ